MFDDSSPIGRLTVESLADDGTPETTHEQGIHSLLDNYYSWWGGIGSTGSTFQMTDASGSTNKFVVDAEAMNDPVGRIAVGIGTAGFSQSDNSLANGNTRKDIAGFTTNTSTQTVSWTVTVNASTNIDVTETGWLYGEILDTTGSPRSVFMERTVLTDPVNTGSNGDISVTYEWDYPAP